MHDFIIMALYHACSKGQTAAIGCAQRARASDVQGAHLVYATCTHAYVVARGPPKRATFYSVEFMKLQCGRIKKHVYQPRCCTRVAVEEHMRAALTISGLGVATTSERSATSWWSPSLVQAAVRGITGCEARSGGWWRHTCTRCSKTSWASAQGIGLLCNMYYMM